MRTIPFEILDVGDDATLFVAVDCSNPLASRFLSIIPASLAKLRRYKVTVLLFSDVITEVRTLYPATIRRVFEMVPRPEGKPSLDPLINFVMCASPYRTERNRPKLFVFSDGDVTTYWNLGVMAQVVEITWLHHIHTKRVITPTIGTRFAIDLGVPMMKRYPVRLYLRHRDYDNQYMLSIGNDGGLVTVAERSLDLNGVDFQISLDELVQVAHTTFHAPATLAEWILIDNLAWCYPLFQGD